MHLQIEVPHPVIVPVPRPFPVRVPISRPVAVPVLQELFVPIEKPVPYPVYKNIPYPVEKLVPVPVEKEVSACQCKLIQPRWDLVYSYSTGGDWLRANRCQSEYVAVLTLRNGTAVISRSTSSINIGYQQCCLMLVIDAFLLFQTTDYVATLHVGNLCGLSLIFLNNTQPFACRSRYYCYWLIVLKIYLVLRDSSHMF